MYTCFIDYRKAFDTVSREALLYKLYQLGIQGRFFTCLEHMYSNSKAKIKLLNKISEALEVLIGTEQGHPMSPELFKCYLLGLSSDLDSTPGVQSPVLGSQKVTHLLWADDLVLLALDRESLQKLINTVHSYCILWGLTVNLEKTAVLVFNKTGRVLKSSHGLLYGNTAIPAEKEYCYLGVTFTLNGNFKKAQDMLRIKGLRAFFSLKNLVDIYSLNVNSIFRLFDSLIMPVFTYGCQIWLPETEFIKLITDDKKLTNERNFMTKIASDKLEQIHLKFIKWTLGLTSKASNLVCWGDTGRYPIVIQVIKQTINYLKRLKHLSSQGETLVGHAYSEQAKLSLPWYTRMHELIKVMSLSDPISPIKARSALVNKFDRLWESAIPQYSKLNFYKEIKSKISFEPYLLLSEFKKRKAIAQLRSSNHRLNNETGRFVPGKQNANYQKVIDQGIWRKCCKTCSDTAAEYLAHLPFFEPIIEDEQHFLVSCPRYHHIRLGLSDCLKSAIVSWDYERIKELFRKENVVALANYIQQLLKIRFPKPPDATKKDESEQDEKDDHEER